MAKISTPNQDIIEPHLCKKSHDLHRKRFFKPPSNFWNLMKILNPHPNSENFYLAHEAWIIFLDLLGSENRDFFTISTFKMCVNILKTHPNWLRFEKY